MPFSRSQYYVHKKLLENQESLDIVDNRGNGGKRKLSPEAEEYLAGCLRKSPSLSLAWLQEAVAERFGCKIGISGMSRAVERLTGRQDRRPRGRPKKAEDTSSETNPPGGFELIIALAYHLKWPDRVKGIIEQSLSTLKRTERFRSSNKHKDVKGRSSSGKFTESYNQRKEVRLSRFASVDEKRKTKNWQSMDLIRDSTNTLARKSTAILSLPVITMNGAVRDVNVPWGEALKDLCGYNYKQSSIYRYLSELKYLGISRRLLDDLPKFWRECWADQVEKLQGPVFCYYIDGHTKALWSSQRVKQNRVSMLGRVMGCLEHVFIHDGFGHPIYFETYSGHAPVGEHIPGLFEKIEESILELPGSAPRVYRAIVMDAASNSVRTLRAFAAQKTYHYVTPLDDNQWDPRRIRSQSHPTRYRYGKATLRDLEIELEDSHEKGYLVTSRAISINWDNGKMTVLLTSLPGDIIDTSTVVWSYFRRWPAQELQFRDNKAAVSLNRVAGYGKAEVDNPQVREEQKKLGDSIGNLKKVLHCPLEEISKHENAIANLIPKERSIRSRSTLKQGKRLLAKSYRDKFEEYGKAIRRHKRNIKAIEKEHQQEFKLLRRKQQEWLHIQGKERVYSVDVELDQIVTYHRICLAHLFAYFAKHFPGTPRISMSKLIHRIMHLPAEIRQTREERVILLHYNKKDPTMMRMLQRAIEKLNALCIQGPHKKRMTFILGDCPD